METRPIRGRFLFSEAELRYERTVERGSLNGSGRQLMQLAVAVHIYQGQALVLRRSRRDRLKHIYPILKENDLFILRQEFEDHIRFMLRTVCGNVSDEIELIDK